MSIPETENQHESEADAEPSPSVLIEAYSKAAPKTGSNRDLIKAATTAIAYLIFLQIVEHIQSGAYPLILTTTLISLVFTLLFTVLLARGLRSAKALAIAGIASAVAIGPSIVIPVLVRLNPTLPFWGWLGPHFKTYRHLIHALSGVDSLLLVTSAVSVGVLISRVVREFKMLLPISVVLALVDLYVVFGGGLVTQAQHGNTVASSMMSGLTVKLPTVHRPLGAAPMQLAVGFADYLFIALFFACFVKFHAPGKRTFLTLCFTLAAYMMIVAVKDVALPALVPIAVVVVSMNFRRFQFERQELFAMLYAGIIVGIIGGVLYWRTSAHEKNEIQGDAAGPPAQGSAAPVTSSH